MSQESTTSETTPNRADSQPTATNRVTRQAALTVVLLGLVAVEPAAAQTNAVCSADNLPSMIEGFFQLTTGLGIIGLAVVWQADSLIEMFTLNPDQKKGLKRHKRSAMKSTVVLVILGPLYTVAGAMMGLPLAQCVDLVPW
ncbi:hypothetical protein Halar_0561 (plasmid) [halophilic archaeon DL31]|nr:hypothetical protein Halar_0561 [halophilic archaeon DL31]